MSVRSGCARGHLCRWGPRVADAGDVHELIGEAGHEQDPAHCPGLVPLLAPAAPAHNGTWYAELLVDKRDYEERASQDCGDRNVSDVRAKGGAHCLSMHALSNLRMRTSLTQSSFTPGFTARA